MLISQFRLGTGLFYDGPLFFGCPEARNEAAGSRNKLPGIKA